MPQLYSSRTATGARRHALALFAIVACAHAATATTVIAPSFDQLVARAEVIFQGTATDVRCVWEGEGQQHKIVSYVTFKVEDVLKGTVANSYTLRMLGGTVGDRTLTVSDAPRFAVGDRDILFVEHNGTQYMPLVGIMYGRYRLQRDELTGADVIATNSGDRVSQLDAQGLPVVAASGAAALSPEQFKAAIHAKLNDVQ